jgi:hypothetical protein
VILSVGFVIALDLKLAMTSRLDLSLPDLETRVEDLFACFFVGMASFDLTVSYRSCRVFRLGRFSKTWSLTTEAGGGVESVVLELYPPPLSTGVLL